MQFLPFIAVCLIAVCPGEHGEAKRAAGAAPPSAADLRALPGVHTVAVHPARNGATHRIIHIRNWHFVSKADFAADLRALEDGPLSSDEIDSRYEQFLGEVEAVQAEQRQLLKRLIHDHGLKQVFIEGLTKEERPAFQKRIATLREFEKRKPKGDSPIEQFLLHMNRLDLLEIGAAGQLYLQGKLAGVLPAEDAAAWKQANPVRDDGRVVFDEKQNAARENAVVQRLLSRGPLAVVIMGGGHDLADDADRLSQGACEVITVTMKAYQTVAE